MKTWFIIGVFLIATSTLVPKTASAQAGSTGGTIGKTDKSASGGEPEQSRPSTIKKPGSTLATQPADSSFGTSACSKAVGVWFWVTQEVTIKSDGKVESPGGPGTWSCVEGKLHVHWIDFAIPLEIMSISSDGKSMTSENTISRPRRVR
jgi:hypothetical protein